MKKNILIIINSEEYIRNYITNNSFSEIEKFFLCSYLLSDKIKNINSFNQNITLNWYQTNEIMETRHFRLFNILMWRYRAKSSSFYFRAMRNRKFSFHFSEGDSLKIKFKKLILAAFSKLIRLAVDFLCANKIIFPLYYNWCKYRLKINSDFEEKIKQCTPNVILMPSAAYDADGIDAARIGEKIGVPVVFLIDNWDNLSSKSILWSKPSHLGVWGEQSVEHAVTIQGFKKEQVTCIGTPRFDKYFEVRDLELQSKFDFKYILFVGTALAFDEMGVLLLLNDIISRNLDIFNGVKIIYRPHPWRQSDDSIIGKTMDHVIIDPQLLTAYSKKGLAEDNYPDLSYYPSLLKNAEFVTGGLTSMLIEALIFRKRFLALVYDDGKNFTSQHNAFKYYTHFRGLKSVNAMAFCESIDKLESTFINTWRTRNIVDIEEVDLQRKYFYFDDSRSYGQRLLDLCNDISLKQATFELHQG